MFEGFLSKLCANFNTNEAVVVGSIAVKESGNQLLRREYDAKVVEVMVILLVETLIGAVNIKLYILFFLDHSIMFSTLFQNFVFT